MNQTVSCKIEIIPSPDRTAWIISLTEEAAFEAAILLAMLDQGKLPQVRFVDKSRSAAIQPAPLGYILTLKTSGVRIQIPVTGIWLEDLTGTLMQAYAQGWSDQAHLELQHQNARVTVAVLPSNE